MGYFANSDESMYYEAEYCEKCIHFGNNEDLCNDCPVIEAHAQFNYEDCNNKDSILHILIPRDKDGFNEECRMFHSKE